MNRTVQAMAALSSCALSSIALTHPMDQDDHDGRIHDMNGPRADAPIPP